MTTDRELLAQTADELGYTTDAQILRKGRGAFIQVNAALRAITAARAQGRQEGVGAAAKLCEEMTILFTSRGACLMLGTAIRSLDPPAGDAAIEALKPVEGAGG